MDWIRVYRIDLPVTEHPNTRLSPSIARIHWTAAGKNLRSTWKHRQIKSKLFEIARNAKSYFCTTPESNIILFKLGWCLRRVDYCRFRRFSSKTDWKPIQCDGRLVSIDYGYNHYSGWGRRHLPRRISGQKIQFDLCGHYKDVSGRDDVRNHIHRLLFHFVSKFEIRRRDVAVYDWWHGSRRHWCWYREQRNRPSIPIGQRM